MWLMHAYSNLNIYQYLQVSCKLLCNRLCNNFPVLFYCIVFLELLLFNPPLLLTILLSILVYPLLSFFHCWCCFLDRTKCYLFLLLSVFCFILSSSLNICFSAIVSAVFSGLLVVKSCRASRIRNLGICFFGQLIICFCTQSCASFFYASQIVVCSCIYYAKV